MTPIPTIVAFREAGWSYARIAKRLNLTRNQVAGVIYRAGKTQDTVRGLKAADPAFRALVVADEGTIKEVSERWGLSTSTVGNWRRGLGCVK